jgi:HD-GYP domain-containing protein (c-di-GMP phosphodiesterase class II)
VPSDLTYGELLDSFQDQRLLVEIGRELMRERNIERLLRRILEVSRLMTGADAGSIFLAEEIAGQPMLRFKYSHTVSMDLPYEEFTMPRTVKSIAGYVSLTGTVLNIPDVYKLAADLPFSFNRYFDVAHGYRTKSMLAVPMTDHTGAIVGVIQLLNSKESHSTMGKNPDAILLSTPEDFENVVVPFKDRYEALMEAVAAQAAIALENAAMIKRIQSQFEQFVAAAVEAVEARDPATSGHSSRVAQYSVRIALHLNAQAGARGEKAPFNESHLKELEYAGLLHDFGKVYINPSIFLKAKKLFPEDFDRLMLRLKYLRRSLELEFALREVEVDSAGRALLETQRQQAVDEVAEIIAIIAKLNEPAVFTEDPELMIKRIVDSPLSGATGIDAEPIPILTDTEAGNLRIPRGSLNAAERQEIERHVVRSYEFVKQIPWPPEYARIPDFVRAHHEMLDGSGYPDHLKADQIPFQARILAVVDIYDALTASDRPYKKAVPQEKALAIIQGDAERGKLDAALVKAMVEVMTEKAPAPSA